MIRRFLRIPTVNLSRDFHHHDLSVCKVGYEKCRKMGKSPCKILCSSTRADKMHYPFDAAGIARRTEEEDNSAVRYQPSDIAQKAICIQINPKSNPRFFLTCESIFLQPILTVISSAQLEDTSMEEDAERKIGWLLKSIFAGTAVYFGYQFFPYMGDNLMQQSISLLCVKDPLFKRMGASRISRFATDDERSTKIIEMGGIERLVTMLDGATDDRTRKAALKALDALSHTDAAVKALHEAGAVAIIKSTPNSSDGEVTKYKSNLFKRFQDLKYETPLLEME